MPVCLPILQPEQKGRAVNEDGRPFTFCLAIMVRRLACPSLLCQRKDIRVDWSSDGVTKLMLTSGRRSL